MTFGEKLQKLRKQQGLSQEKLAERLGVSRQAVSKWELGDSLPETENIKQLNKLFGVSIDYLLIDEIEEEGNPPSQSERAIAQPSRHRTGIFVTGAVFAGLGGIGGIVLLVLSSIIQVPVIKKRFLPDGKIEYFGGGGVVGYSFTEFIMHYNLGVLLTLLAIFLVAGIAAMVISVKGE